MNWSAVQLAQRRHGTDRLPFFLAAHRAGSVARHHLPALAAWPHWLQLHQNAVVMTAADPSAAMAAINATLRHLGLVRGWRDEIYGVPSLDSGQVLACVERAAARFWGTLTLGAHATGYVADTQGRPTHLWIAQRSWAKATDPGMLDNLVGGGVPHGQSPWQALVRESWEEAGLEPALASTARAGPIIRLHRDVAEGLQLEDVHSHDLLLPPGLQPVNQDGEVAAFQCLPVPQALDCAAAGEMTVDAALVTLDFALRHHLCSAPDAVWQLMRDAP